MYFKARKLDLERLMDRDRSKLEKLNEDPKLYIKFLS